MILNCRYHVYGIIINYISLKLNALGYIFVAESRYMFYIFKHFYTMHRKLQSLVTQNKGHFTV